MLNNIEKSVKDNGVRLFLIDIDGTLKDLACEHIEALKEMIRMREKWNCKIRYEIALALNRLFMVFVKACIFPTNKKMQIILCYINSVMFGEKFVDFKDEYFSFYDSIRILFNDSHQVLSEIERLGAKYILVSKNEQNINFFGCKNVFEPSLILICNTSGNKLDVLKRAIKFANTSEVKKISIDQIVVMGDNFWDDIVPAMQLGTRVLWVNKYRSKSKRICNYILRILYKKAMNTSN